MLHVWPYRNRRIFIMTTILKRKSLHPLQPISKGYSLSTLSNRQVLNCKKTSNYSRGTSCIFVTCLQREGLRGFDYILWRTNLMRSHSGSQDGPKIPKIFNGNFQCFPGYFKHFDHYSDYNFLHKTYLGLSMHVLHPQRTDFRHRGNSGHRYLLWRLWSEEIRLEPDSEKSLWIECYREAG